METITPEKLSKLGEKWLESKIQRMRNLLKIAEPDEALYREIMLSLGYPKNKVQFLELALLLPFKEIKNLKERKIIEKALLYRAGFINDKEELPESFDFLFSYTPYFFKFIFYKFNNFIVKFYIFWFLLLLNAYFGSITISKRVNILIFLLIFRK